jgi:hypothetical protein
MTVQSPEIDIGVLDLAEPTLLLLGDAEAFRWLANELGAFHAIVLGSQRAGGRRVSLHILPAERDSELSRQGNDFFWQLSSAEAEKIARSLSALADSPRPAHAYLDPAVSSTATHIVASIGEYDPDRVFQVTDA